MSKPTTSRATKALAAGLVFTITQVLLGGGLARASASGAATAAPANRASAPAAGYLATRGNGSVTVDGNAARTGETVFSGQQISTPEGVGASLYVSGLGRVDVAPASSLTVSFGGSRLSARVAGGCAILTPARGTEVLVETRAASERSDSAPIDLCVDPRDGMALKGAAADSGAGAVGGDQEGTGTGSAGAGGLGTGTSILLTAASFGGFSLISYHAVSGPGCRRGRNFSPTVPRGPSDECP